MDANSIKISETSSGPINHHCHDYEKDISKPTDNIIDTQKFDFFSSKQLIDLQNNLCMCNNQNLIKVPNDAKSEQATLIKTQKSDALSDNLINTLDN